MKFAPLPPDLLVSFNKSPSVLPFCFPPPPKHGKHGVLTLLSKIIQAQKITSSSSPSYDNKSSTTNTTTTPASNKWAQVADFKWLKVEHSPNWSILPVGERVDDEIWKSIVAVTSPAEAEAEAEGGQKRSSEGLRDVLRRVGVRGFE